MNDFEDHLKEIVEPSKIFLSIKADDNDKNRRIHDNFRSMASSEFPNTHDNYTLTLGKLLEFYSTDAKTEMLWNEVQSAHARIDELENKTRVPEKELDNSF